MRTRRLRMMVVWSGKSSISFLKLATFSSLTILCETKRRLHFSNTNSWAHSSGFNSQPEVRCSTRMDWTQTSTHRPITTGHQLFRPLVATPPLLDRPQSSQTNRTRSTVSPSSLSRQSKPGQSSTGSAHPSSIGFSNRLFIGSGESSSFYQCSLRKSAWRTQPKSSRTKFWTSSACANMNRKKSFWSLVKCHLKSKSS